MKPRRILTSDHANEIFANAVRTRALAVVTTQEEDDWKTFKCRFRECDTNRKFIVLDYQSMNGEALPELIPGQYVGISFRNRSRKVLFATVVEARGRFLLEDQTSVTAIRYRWPDGLTEMQRRAYYRTPLPEGANFMASIWSGGLNARGSAQQSPLDCQSGRLLDISCGGTLIRLNSVSLPTWSENETLGLELNLNDSEPPMLLNAHYRGARQDDVHGVCLAIQFVGLELTVDGRLVLQRLAKIVQRFHQSSGGSRSRSGQPRHRA